jgi:Holliday junction resolvase
MAGKKSKDKGKGYEREVAKFLSESFRESFIRAPHSGAYIGGSNAHRKTSMSQNQISNLKSDIVAPDGWDKLALECKFYKDFSFDGVFTQDNKLLDAWITQVNAAADPGDLKIILMKFNRKGQWVCWHDSAIFDCQYKIRYKDWWFCSWEFFWSEINKEQFKYYCETGIKE